MTIYDLYFEWNNGKWILLLPECTEREALVAVEDLMIKDAPVFSDAQGRFVMEVETYVV